MDPAFRRHSFKSGAVPAPRRGQPAFGSARQAGSLKTTVVGDQEDFAAASRAAAELMIAGFAQAQISIVGRDVAAGGHDAARFAFAGAVSHALAGANDRDFRDRVAAALAHLGVPPRAAARHADDLARGGGLVVVQADAERARRAESVMHRQGLATSYAVGSAPCVDVARAPAHAAAVAGSA
jgi:hypothetical protein